VFDVAPKLRVLAVHATKINQEQYKDRILDIFQRSWENSKDKSPFDNNLRIWNDFFRLLQINPKKHAPSIVALLNRAKYLDAPNFDPPPIVAYYLYICLTMMSTKRA